MGTDEQHQEIGKAFQERNAAQRELACLQRKKDRFFSNANRHVQLWISSNQEIVKVNDNALSAPKGK